MSLQLVSIKTENHIENDQNQKFIEPSLQSPKRFETEVNFFNLTAFPYCELAPKRQIVDTPNLVDAVKC